MVLYTRTPGNEPNRGNLNMLSQTDKQILNSQDFQKLVSARRRIATSFLLVLLSLYLTYGLLSVYSPTVLAAPVFAHGVVPVGVAMGYGILFMIFLFTLIYVWIANSYFSPLEKKIIASIGAQQ
jgi:uncharacterized membrane protein (DUF485 family)